MYQFNFIANVGKCSSHGPPRCNSKGSLSAVLVPNRVVTAQRYPASRTTSFVNSSKSRAHHLGMQTFVPAYPSVVQLWCVIHGFPQALFSLGVSPRWDVRWYGNQNRCRRGSLCGLPPSSASVPGLRLSLTAKTVVKT